MATMTRLKLKLRHRLRFRFRRRLSCKITYRHYLFAVILLLPISFRQPVCAQDKPLSGTINLDRPSDDSVANKSSTTTTFSLGVTRTLSLSKHHAIEKLDLGNFNLFNGNTKEAIAAYRAALAIAPDNWEAHYGLCNCYVSNRNYSKAISECQVMLQLKPNDKTTLFLLGNLLKSQGRITESIATLQRAEKLGAKGSGLHTALGLALAQGDKLDEAMAHLNIALQQDKRGTNADAHLGKAVVLYKQSQKLEALSEIDKAIKASGGRYPQARNFKAEILTNLGRMEEAKTEYLIEINNEDALPSCFQALGNIYLKEGNLEEAAKTFATGLKWYPKDSDIYLGKAVTLEKQGKISPAITAFRSALTLIKDKNKLAIWQKHLSDLEANNSNSH